MSEHNEHGSDYPVAVAVITPSGTFPNDDDYRRANGGEQREQILNAAAQHLRLTNTADWVAYVRNRQVDPKKTFSENELHGIVEVEWHKHEGGGGGA